ncbi:hypothetical protein SAMN04515620_11969 [Collimonas sp. OK607]|uniref:hypothetical protein n=1 Tax=Collimonas sp. OK607 TaxID=1798194 RepID=UPI0008E5575B|nr:hypothetical protein [Collimonas sp. OK607]SFB12544.1 hypothetical protein SAMN04515620_11969 [Collimonas sp. OK607]
MSNRMYLDQLKRITVKPVKAHRHPDASIGIFYTQEIVFHCEGGSKQELTLGLEAGVHALALGDLVTNEQVTI